MISRPDRILLVTDQPLLLLAFRGLLERAGLGVEHAVVNAAELADRMSESALVVIDSDAGLTWETLTAIRRDYPAARLVIWCRRVTPQLVQQALSAGVQGLLSSRLPLAEASQALARIQNGEHQFRFENEWQAAKPAKRALSPREEQVVSLVVGGRTNRQIATALRTTEGSVKVYLSRVFGKTGVKNRHELALVGHGILRRPEVTPTLSDAGFDSTWMFAGNSISEGAI